MIMIHHSFIFGSIFVTVLLSRILTFADSFGGHLVHSRQHVNSFLTKFNGRDPSTSAFMPSQKFLFLASNRNQAALHTTTTTTIQMRRKSETGGASSSSPERSRSIYLLYTGGTIGSVPDDNGLKPANLADFKKLLGKLSQLGTNPETGITDLNLNDDTEQNIDVDYTLGVMDPPLDSTEMVPKNWYQIALQILQAFKENPTYDGAVVLHGTDTMAYTSSALAFLLIGLTKPVVVTGSQIPLIKPRSDALRNFVSSVAVSAEGYRQGLAEVTVVFGSRILRGCRTTKVNADAFSGFDTPNYPYLGTNALTIEIDKSVTLKASQKNPTRLLDCSDKVETRMKSLKKAIDSELDLFSIIAVHLYPGISETTVANMINGTSPPVVGIVVRSYGAGNVPDNISGDDGPLAAAYRRGAVIIDTTQVLAGHVSIGTYAASSKMAGISVSGAGMTTEAAISKLVSIFANPEMYTKGCCDPPNWKKDPIAFQEFAENLMKKSVVGEMGSPNTPLA